MLPCPVQFTAIDLAFIAAAFLLAVLIWLHNSPGLSQGSGIWRFKSFIISRCAAFYRSTWDARYQDVYVLILYGSQTGTAENFAFALHSFLLSHSVSSAIMSIESLSVDWFYARCDTSDLFSLFVLATYGDGETTDSARSFVQYLERPPVKRLGTTYAVFGLGNSAYPHFNACAKLVDRLLHRYGGTRLLQPVFSDELQDQERTFLTWQLQVTEAIRSRLHVMEAVNSNVPIRPLYQKMSVPRGALTGGKLFVGEPHTLGSYKYQKIPFNSKNPFLAKVIVNEELYNFTVRSCRHIELDIDGSSFSYRPGDHVAVLPSNPMALVESIGELLRINLDEPFALLSSETLNLRKSPFPCPCTYRTALTHYVDLTGPPSLRMLSALADFTENMLEAEQLRFFVSNTTDGQKSYAEHIIQERRTIVDILREFTSVRIPVDLLLELLPRLRPRFYSISCSPLKSDNRLHITMSLIIEQTPKGRRFHGLTTHWLGSLLPQTISEARVPIYLKTSSFHLPRSSRIPIIMVATGTGLAPFRAFIQERQIRLDADGQNANAMLLFFGCRNTREFIYSSEIESARDAGIIQLYLALSREPGVKKTYVQDLLLLRSIEVWRLIDAQHAHVYVCGSPAMVRDVQICFIKVISIQDDKSTDWAERYMDRLRAEGRYHLDVWN